MARERAVPAEPTVVVATGIAAFDEWGHALGARVHDGRTRADTIPAEREVAASAGRSTMMLLAAAAFLFIASAAVLVRGVRASEAETALASAQPVAHAQASQPVSVLETSAAALPDAPSPPALPAAAIPVAELPASAPAQAVDIELPPRGTTITHAPIAAERSERPAPRRGRPAAKPKRSAGGNGGEIVRETPY